METRFHFNETYYCVLSYRVSALDAMYVTYFYTTTNENYQILSVNNTNLPCLHLVGFHSLLSSDNTVTHLTWLPPKNNDDMWLGFCGQRVWKLEDWQFSMAIIVWTKGKFKWMAGKIQRRVDESCLCAFRTAYRLIADRSAYPGQPKHYHWWNLISYEDQSWKEAMLEWRKVQPTKKNLMGSGNLWMVGPNALKSRAIT
jgi:hypothetical protein